VTYASCKSKVKPPQDARWRLISVDEAAGRIRRCKLEERLAQILRRRFSLEAILVSPWLPHENRELCDVLVGCQWGYLFLESKAMAVNAAALDRSTERRLSGFRKQIEKALKQLDGVRRRALSPDFTTVNTGLGTREIESYRHELLHFAIAMSEIHPDLAKLEALWEVAIANAEANKIALHLFDPNELQSMVNLSSSEDEFFGKLNERWDMPASVARLCCMLPQDREALSRIIPDGPLRRFTHGLRDLSFPREGSR
jgi:hypothetical protein